MKSNLLYCISSTVLIVFVTACASNEIGNSKDVNQETIFQHYHITYTEGDEKVKVKAQFRFAGENGTTLLLSSPSSVAFDGEIIRVDSNEVDGAFYETNYPASTFWGKHRFSFTDINRQQLENDFIFNPFKLTNLPSATYRNQPLQIPLNTTILGPEDFIEIFSVDTDSSFVITHKAEDDKYYLTIPLSEMKRQLGDKISIGFTLFRKINLQNNTKEGGYISIEYHLDPVTIKLENSPMFAGKTINF
jgi:hypothetical protein